jgi:hypothetical protein
MSATATAYLRDLVEALDGAFISSWQSTAAWQKQLDAARDYLDGADPAAPTARNVLICPKCLADRSLSPCMGIDSTKCHFAASYLVALAAAPKEPS